VTPTTASRPLARFSVLDLTTVRSGPTCNKILGDFGADVIRVERPGGEGRERVFFDAADLHRNKRSVAVNLQEPRGVAVFKRLAARSDVLVENYQPDVKHRLGVGYEALSRENPRLVYASISGFGQEGPYRDRPGYDPIVQGIVGSHVAHRYRRERPAARGHPDRRSARRLLLRARHPHALLEREVSGRGQKVETSLLEALTGSLSFQAAKFVNTGEVPPPVGNHHPLTAPMGVYRAQDGFFNLAVGNDDMWRRFCKAIEQPALADDARFAGMLARVKHRQALDVVLEAAFAGRPAAEWVESLNAAGVACGPISTVDRVFADPQIRQADLVRDVANAAWGPHKVLALPVHLSRTPARVEHAAPIPGSTPARSSPPWATTPRPSTPCWPTA